jgi:heat shock protein HspQ
MFIMYRSMNMSNFDIGQIIHHKRYDYRGVIVGIDPCCKAPDAWYYSNRTQPDRDRPWYHVLVHGGAETYVAEENLEIDPTGEAVTHPYLRHLFALHLNGRYLRYCPN